MGGPQRSQVFLDWGSLLLISLLFLWPSWLYGSWPGTGVDLYGTVWFYGWIRQSFELGFDPSFTNLFFYPDGKEIFTHTGNNFLDAYASLPFQWILGDHFIGPFISSLVLLNVMGLRWFLREIGCSIYVRWLMGVIWLFNPFVWSEIAMGRPTQVLLCPTFIALVFLYRMLHEDRRAWIGLGISVAVQGWSYWFYAYFLVMFLTVVGLFEWYRTKVSWRILVWDILKSMLLCVLLIAPAILPIVYTAMNAVLPGVGLNRSLNVELIAEQLVPWMRGVQIFEPIGHPYFRNVLSGSAIGLSLLLAIRYPKWIVVGLGMLIISVGPHQIIEDSKILNPVYLYLVQVLPFFERLWFPYRAAAFVFIAVTLHLSEYLRSRILSLQMRIALPCFVLGAGLWDASFVNSLPLVHTELPNSEAKECLTGPTIQIPIGFVHPTMIWQSSHPVPFFGGMGENGLVFLPNGYQLRLQNPFIEYLRSASLYANSKKKYSPYDRKRIEEVGFEYILWDRGLTEMELLKRKGAATRPQSLFNIQANLIEKFGPPVCVDRQWVIFALDSVPSSSTSMPISDDWTWEQPELSTYELRLRELGLVPK